MESLLKCRMFRLVPRFSALTIILIFLLWAGASFSAERFINLSPVYQLLLFQDDETVSAPSNLYVSTCFTQTFPQRGIADCWQLYWTDNSKNESGFIVEKKCWMDGDPEPVNFETWKTYPPNTTQAQYLFGSWETGDHTCPGEGPAIWKFRVKAMKGNLSSDYAGPVTSHLCPNLNPPDGSYYPLTLDAPIAGMVKLVWTDYLEGETGWRLLRQELDAGDHVVSIVEQILPPGSDETYTYYDIHLKPSTKYTYHVSPRYASENMTCDTMISQWGSATTMATTMPPLAPTSLSVSAVAKSSTSMSLSWTDNAVNESGFFIFRSQDNLNFEKIQTLATNVTSFTDTGLTPCTTYYYKVAAYNSAGSSDDAEGNGTAAPAAPAGLMATTGPGVFGIHLDWQDAPCAVQYHVYSIRSPGDPYEQLVEPPEGILESQVNVLDVDPDIYFFYRVSAVDANGNEGDLSCTTAAQAPNGGATSLGDPCKAAVGWAKSPVPVNLWGSWENFINQVRIGWDSVPLTWDGNGQPTSYAAQYYVEISIDNVQWYDVPGTPISHPYNPPDATPIMLTVPVSYSDTVYYFRLKTKFVYDGHEMWSNPAFVQAKTATVAPPPENNILPAPGLVVSKYYPGKIMVGWSTITGATGYKVYRSTSRDSGYSLIKTFNSTVTRFDDTTVQPWTDYWYKVRAMNGTVEGLLSQPEYGNASAF